MREKRKKGGQEKEERRGGSRDGRGKPIYVVVSSYNMHSHYIIITS
jgi:hypothetical protein